MTAHHSVYVIELDPAILVEDPGFRAENPLHISGYDCLYVGSTGLSRQERLANHRIGHKASKRAMPYIRDLRSDLWTGYEDETMRWEDALVAEKELAEKLRAAGYAVWQK